MTVSFDAELPGEASSLLLQPVLLACHHDEVYAFSGETFGDRKTDADARAGNHGDFSFESEIHGLW